VYPVNPKRSSVLGIRAYPRIAAVPQSVDLAVIATPAPTVPGIVAECVEAGVPGAIIISAGFKECGPAGAELEKQICAEARRSNMRIIGPNCLGVMVPHAGFNATFAGAMARPGNVAFISQSGALCTAILDWSIRENVGFSAFISVGSMLDVGWGDLIDYLGDDPHTRSIVIYMESIGDARSFLSAAREVALTKPIVVIKVGKSEAASKAAASHTGSLTGSDEVLEAAFRRCGVLRVNNLDELFDVAEVLAKQPRPRGPRLAIITNGGGPGALATDTLISHGGQLAELSSESLAALDQLLPAHWSHGDPIDILGDADPDRYAKAVQIVAKDRNNDGLLVILTPQAMTDPMQTAERLKAFSKLDGKPILASWMGGAEVDPARSILNDAGIPTFDYPDTAARAFQYMWRYSYNLCALYETPVLLTEANEVASSRVLAETLLQTARKSGRTLLTEYESKQILEAYGIPVVETRVAVTEDEAVKLASEMGYPVVLKLHSHTITHKSDVGGVQLNLSNATAVRRAWRAIESSVSEKAGQKHFLGVTVQPMMKLSGHELIIGSSIDSQFGPVLLFGAGGKFVEVFRDRAVALPPLNATLALRLMEQTRIFQALKGVRGEKPINLAALETLLVKFSQLVIEQRWIKEIDINPLLASSEGLVALDARVVLNGEVAEEKLPKPAIRPYPTQYIKSWKLKDGTPVTIRPIRPEDEPLMVDFHATLSERSVYYRYFGHLKLGDRVAHERLTRICFNDYDREIALVADRQLANSEHREILGVGRLTKLRGTNMAEFAIVVSDRWQHHGLGTELLELLVHIGREEKLERIIGHILPDNRDMQQVSRRVGFKLHHDAGEGECVAEIAL
jgi:acetyltransferase